MDPNTHRYEAVAHTVDRPADLARVIERALAERRAGLPPPAERSELIEHLIGPRDGQAALRIAQALEARALPMS
jgi:hypothetical protein